MPVHHFQIVPYNPKTHTGRLVRLDPACYLGHSFVHWSMAMERRATGWLNACHHARIRELLCHVLGRYALLCPCYCLMPDHAHLLWVGVAERSDQRAAAALFRAAWNLELKSGGWKLQRQAFDHVLRAEEREHGAFATVAHYVLRNPVRAGLVADWTAYPFLGAIIPGFPDFDPRDEDYWDRFWRVYGKCAEAAAES